MNVFRTRRSVAATAGLVVAGSLVLTGCNDSKKSGEKTNPDSGPPSGVSTAAASNSPSAAGASAGSSAGSSSAATAPTSGANGGGSGSDSGSGGAAVKPGTVLKLGQAATLDYVSGSKKSTISINVTSIDAGSPADLSSLKMSGGSVQGMTPFYIKYTVTNAGTTDLSYSSASSMHGLMADGGMANPLILFGGSLPQCADNTAPSGFTQGKSYQTCVIALAPTGSKVAGAEWTGEPYEKLHDGVSWGVKAR